MNPDGQVVLSKRSFLQRIVRGVMVEFRVATRAWKQVSERGWVGGWGQRERRGGGSGEWGVRHPRVETGHFFFFFISLKPRVE